MEKDIYIVNRMQKYINTHIEDSITIDDVSNHVSYSSSHCMRLFSKYLKISFKKYLRRLKLANAALKIRDNNIKIIDVSTNLGYSSPDSFARAFCKEFGCNPKEYALNTQPIRLFIGWEIIIENKKERIVNDMSTKNIFIQIVTRPHRKVIIKRGINATDYFEYCEEVGCDVFGTLLSIKGNDEPVCMWLPDRLIKPNTSKYVQGMEVDLDYMKKIPEGFEIIELKESTFIKFQSEKYDDNDFMEMIGQVWNAIEKFDPLTIGYEWDNSEPRIQFEPLGSRGYIELVPVKKK